MQEWALKSMTSRQVEKGRGKEPGKGIKERGRQGESNSKKKSGDMKGKWWDEEQIGRG